MFRQLSVHPEQVSIERLLANAYEAFETQALSISGRIVLWGSVQSKEDLRDRFLTIKGKSNLLDRRRNLSHDEESEWIEIDSASQDAWDYLTRVRQNNGQEISRESLVTYWSAFENCLKSISVAFWLANEHDVPKLGGQIYVPIDKVKSGRKQVKSEWNAMASFPKGRDFYEKAIVAVNPYPDKYRFSTIEDGLWTRIGEASDVRNTIVHSMALAGEQLSFFGVTYSTGEEVLVNAASLRSLVKDMKSVLSPFRTGITMDDL